MAEPFQIPSDKQLRANTKEFDLNREQVRELELTIRHAHEDLAGFYRTRMDRSERASRIDKLKEMHAAITRLLKVLGPNAAVIDDVNESLPFNMRELIGEVISPDLIAEVTGRTRHSLQHGQGRRAAGLEHGTRLLAAQLRLIKEPLDAWLAAYTVDPGGRESDNTRNYLIAALSRAAPAVIGREATATANGTFARLVTAVCHACGLDDNGLEKRVERVLAGLRDSTS